MNSFELVTLIEDISVVLNRAAMSIPVNAENAKLLQEIFALNERAGNLIRKWRNTHE